MSGLSVSLPPGSYYQLALLAGADLAQAVPEPLLFDQRIPRLRAKVPVGVYVAFDQYWHVAYVGSVWRPNNPRGLEERISEHLRDRRKSFSWRGAWILPLRLTITPAELRRLEGHIGRTLRPFMSRRLPA